MYVDKCFQINSPKTSPTGVKLGREVFTGVSRLYPADQTELPSLINTVSLEPSHIYSRFTVSGHFQGKTAVE